MSSASASSSTLPFPPVSSSSNARGERFGAASASIPHSSSQTWRLSEPSSSESGFTIVPTPPEEIPALPKMTRAPHTLQRAHTRSKSNRSRQASANTTRSNSDEPRLLENTLKLESLGVSDFTPNPSIAPKVTISAKCRPDPKVIFDQGPFMRSRQSSKANGHAPASESTVGPSNESASAIQAISLSTLAQQLSSTSSTAGTTSLSSPTSSTGPLPNVGTPASSFITDTDAVMPTSPTLARKAAWSKPRSWADLASRMGPPPFTGSPSVFSENVNGEGSSLHSPDHSLSANTSPQRRSRTINGDRARSKLTPTNGRGKLLSLASIIAQAETQFSAPLTYPRGMVNTGNMCFANAILQTLVYCAPFYNLFRLLGEVVPHDFHNSTPLMEAAIQFLNEFQVISDDVQRNFITSQPAAVDALRELHAASEPFVPEALYDAMKLTKRFDLMRRGHQEDAEEFLGFFLDTLHEELQITMRKAEARNAHTINGKTNANSGAGAKNTAHSEDGEVSQEIAAEEEEEEEREVNRPSSPTEGEGWLEVGQKGKTSFTRTTLTAHSPITRIFGGKLRSVLRTPGSKDSVTLEPYQPLQLDIQPPHVTTIEEALENLTRPEIISGVMSSARTLVDATKQVFIETLPPVLVVHLKRFYYDDIGGVQKSSKVLGYGPTLEIAESVISPARRAEAQRRYKLFGVVYHHGRYASGGHYTVDVLRQDRSEWLHIDDTTWAVTAAPSARATLPVANGAIATAIPASVGTSNTVPSSPKAASASHAPAVGDVGGGSAYLMFYAREDAIESLASSSVASSSAKASKNARHSDANAATGNGLLPPISARKLAEAATAGPGPVVPGAPLGARRAGSQSVGHTEGQTKAATASMPRPQPRR